MLALMYCSQMHEALFIFGRGRIFFSSVVQLRLYLLICPQVHDSSVTFFCKVFFCVVVIFSVLNLKKKTLLPNLFKERYYLLAFFSFTLVTGLEMLIILFP